MKFLLVVVTVALSLINTNANANDGKITPAILASFNASFKNASNVEWKATGNFFKADFSFNNQFVQAYYDASANLIAITRNICSNQLPMTLQSNLKKSYDAYWISDLFELSDDNGTAYYVTIENGSAKITLKSTGSNDWTVFQKQRKS